MSTEKKDRLGMSSRAIHAGEPRNHYADAITTPIFQTSTFVFRNSADIEDYTKNKKERFEYGRYGNPTELIAQKRLADLEGAEDCVVFSSGMMAITTTILSLVRTGDHIVITDDSYKKTLEFCKSYLKRFGIECTIVPFGDYDALEAAIKDNTRFIFSESPTNPYLNVFDLVLLKEIAERHGVMTLITAPSPRPSTRGLWSSASISSPTAPPSISPDTTIFWPARSWAARTSSHPSATSTSPWAGSSTLTAAICCFGGSRPSPCGSRGRTKLP